MSIRNKIKTARFFFKPKKIIVLCEAYFGAEWMELSLKKLEPYVEKILVVIGEDTYDSSGIPRENVDEIYGKLSKNNYKYDILRGRWSSEQEQQNDALNYIRNNHKECTHLFKVDTDEIYTPKELLKIKEIIRKPAFFNKILRVKMYTYIKTVFHRVSPIEEYCPIAIIPILPYIQFSGPRQAVGANYKIMDCKMHHYSLVRKKDESIQTKFKTRGDVKTNQLVENWYQKFYIGFNEKMTNFHTIKGSETQWKTIETVSENKLPKGVPELYKSWGKR